jgi:hypothetical protein
MLHPYEEAMRYDCQAYSTDQWRICSMSDVQVQRCLWRLVMRDLVADLMETVLVVAPEYRCSKRVFAV